MIGDNANRAPDHMPAANQPHLRILSKVVQSVSVLRCFAVGMKVVMTDSRGSWKAARAASDMPLTRRIWVGSMGLWRVK